MTADRVPEPQGLAEVIRDVLSEHGLANRQVAAITPDLAAAVDAWLRDQLGREDVRSRLAAVHWSAWSLNDAERHGVETQEAHNRHMTAAVLAALPAALGLSETGGAGS